MPGDKLTLQTETGRDGGEDRNAELKSLVERAINGDDRALYDLCAQITKSVYFHAIRLVGNQADAEDVMQEVCLRVCEKIRELRSPEAFRGWLSKITSNEARELYRKKAKRGVVLNIDDYLDSIIEEKKDFLPEEYTQKEEYRQAVVEIIDTLPRRQREAVMLRYMGELGVTEVAKEMGIGPPRVTEYLALAREKLKTEMEKRQLQPEGYKSNYSLAPVSLVLGNILRQQSELAAPDPMAAQTVLLKCEALIKAAPAPVNPAIVPPAKTPVVSALVSVAAAALVTAGIALWARPVPAPTQPQIYIPAAQEFSTERHVNGAVVFSGGEDRGEGLAWLNPVSAKPEFEDGSEDAAVTEWWITTMADENEILYSGNDSDPDGALASLKQKEGDDVYMIFFRAENEAGYASRIGRSFRIANADNSNSTI